jgi:hypothetical protein
MISKLKEVFDKHKAITIAVIGETCDIWDSLPEDEVEFQNKVFELYREKLKLLTQEELLDCACSYAAQEAWANVGDRFYIKRYSGH